MPTGCSTASAPVRALSTPLIRLARDLHGAVSVTSRNRTMQALCKQLHESCAAEYGAVTGTRDYGSGPVGRSSGRWLRTIYITTHPCAISSSFHFPHPDLTHLLLPSSFLYGSARSSHLAGIATCPVRLQELRLDSGLDLVLTPVPTHVYGSDSLHQHITHSLNAQPFVRILQPPASLASGYPHLSCLKLPPFRLHSGQPKELVLIAAVSSMDTADRWITAIPTSPH